MTVKLTVYELEKIPRERLGSRLARRLQKFDELHAGPTEAWIFDWQYRKFIQAQNWVGVIEIPGLSIEILPKIGLRDESDPAALKTARRNLLYMLTLAGVLKVRPRDVARLDRNRAPLLEALIAAFADELRYECGRGLSRKYLSHEENARCLAGKLLVTRHLMVNVARPDRLYIDRDEFTADNTFNQILKAATRSLFGYTHLATTRRTLGECLEHLSDVQDKDARSLDVGRVHIDRNAARFRNLLGFARLVLSGHAVGASRGDYGTFSILFPMEKVFEQFVGGLLRKYVDSLGIEEASVQLQARGRWLLRRENGRPAYALRPDVVVRDRHGRAALVLDTKWKSLQDRDGRPKAAASADLYQLYAYSRRYGSNQNFLMFPKSKNARASTYIVEGDETKKVHIELLDVSTDLWQMGATVLDGVRERLTV